MADKVEFKDMHAIHGLLFASLVTFAIKYGGKTEWPAAAAGGALTGGAAFWYMSKYGHPWEKKG